VGGSFRQLGEVLLWFQTDGNASGAAGFYELLEADILSLPGDADVVKFPAPGPDRLGHRMQPVQNFHVTQFTCLRKIDTLEIPRTGELHPNLHFLSWSSQFDEEIKNSGQVSYRERL
jgi:hypothetical protein